MKTIHAPCPIVFDLDGTLIDSAPDIHAAANAVLFQNGLRRLSLERIRSFIGGGVEILWTRIGSEVGADPCRARDLLASFMTRYHAATHLTKMYPNALTCLGLLADLGHPLGICTNKPAKATDSILQHFGIRELFGTIVTADTLPQRKPDPAPLVLALTELGGDNAAPHGIFVGDSEYDVECAYAASVPILLFTQGYRRTPLDRLPHFAAFEDFAELPVLIEKASFVTTSLTSSNCHP